MSANPQGAVLASALLDRLPALTDELLKRVLEQSDIRGKQSEHLRRRLPGSHR